MRLIVGQLGGLHGLSWRVWVKGDDIYVKARALQGSLKVSVHPPGPKGSDAAFFCGFEASWLAQHPDGMEPPDHPRIERYWPRELGPGVRRIASIRVHADALRSSLPVAKRHFWVTPPKPDRAVEVHVLLMQRREDARRRFDEHQSGLLGGVVDESVMGDVLIYQGGEDSDIARVGLRIHGESASGRAMSSDIEAASMAIDSRDGSLILEELPVRVDFPEP